MSKKTRVCENCGKVVSAQGYWSHRRSVACQNHKFFESNPWFPALIGILMVAIAIFAVIHGNGWK